MQPFPFAPWVWRDPSVLHPGSPTTQDDRDSARADEQASTGLTGYDVEATDGRIGSIDEASYEVGAAYLVVDTGPWIFGRKVLLPAGTVESVDHQDRKVYVDRTKDEIKNSPEYDKDTFTTTEYRDRVGGYYTDIYRNTPPPLM
jgi:hypothetical protein